MRTILAAAVLVAMTTAVSAQNLSCVGGRASVNCTVYDGGFGPTKIIHVPPHPPTEAELRWEEYCRPRVVQRPPDYVRRYEYAHPGCENGRTR